jgi:hypothetical protein
MSRVTMAGVPSRIAGDPTGVCARMECDVMECRVTGLCDCLGRGGKGRGSNPEMVLRSSLGLL